MHVPKPLVLAVSSAFRVGSCHEHASHLLRSGLRPEVRSTCWCHVRTMTLHLPHVYFASQAPPACCTRSEPHTLLCFDQLPDTIQKGAEVTESGLAGRPISASARMRYFRQEANRRKHSFSCDHVWTFSLYQVCIIDTCKHCPAWRAGRAQVSAHLIHGQSSITSVAPAAMF